MEKRHRLDIRSQTAFEHHHEYDTKRDRQLAGTYNGTLSVKAFNGLATKVTTALAASSK